MSSTIRTGFLVVAAGVCGVVAVLGWRGHVNLKRTRAARANREAELSQVAEAPPPYARARVVSLPVVLRGEPARETPAVVALGPETPAASGETNPPPPTSEVSPGPERAEAQTVRRALDLAILRNPGASVGFIDCAEEACMTRVKASDPRVLYAVASDVSVAYQGHAKIVLREHLDGFLGRWFEADVTVGTPEARPVPSLEAELPGAVASVAAPSAP